MAPERAPTVDFDQGVLLAATSHKDQAEGRLIQAGNLCDVAGNPVDLTREGGLFLRTIGGKATYVTVRASMWRNGDEKGDPRVHTTDLMIVHGLNNAHSELSHPTRIATEVEGFAVTDDPDKLSEPVSVAEPDDEHPELFDDCAEEATPPTNNLFEAAMHVYDAYKRLWARTKAKGALLYPGSNLAHRARTVADINPHPYVQKIVNILGRRTLRQRAQENMSPAEAFIWLDGASAQTHVERELDHAAGAFALNTHSVSLSPLTMGLTAASPFSHGEYSPDFDEPYRHIHSKVGYLATRFFGRRIGTPEAGALRKLISEDPRELALEINDRMQHGAINNPGRVGNQHGDVRWRGDLSPHGTAELCAKDTAGGHIESLMATAAFERSFMHVLEQAHKTGRIADLAARFPRVVVANLHERGEELLAQANINSELIAQQGLDAIILSPNGHQSIAREALYEAMQMVHQETQRAESGPYRLQEGVYKWIKIRAGQPKYREIQESYQAHGQSQPLATIMRFYRGGHGTLAHYKRIRVSQLMLCENKTTAQAIAQTQVEVARCHEHYLKHLQPKTAFAFLRNEYDQTS